MVKVPVPQNRATVVDSPDGLHIIVPAPRLLFPMLFLPIWLAGWLFALVFSIRELVRLVQSRAPGGPIGFMIIWLIGWMFGGVFAMSYLAWMLAGREHVILRPDALVIRHELLGLARAREYDLGNILNLRLSPETFDGKGGRDARRLWVTGSGMIAFDYGPKTLRFGGSIDEPEARGILAQMRMRHRFTSTTGAD